MIKYCCLQCFIKMIFKKSWTMKVLMKMMMNMTHMTHMFRKKFASASAPATAAAAASSSSFSRSAPGMPHFSFFCFAFSGPFSPLRCGISPHVLAYISCPLWAKAPKTSHKHPPLLFVLCAHGLLRTHSPNHAAYIYQIAFLYTN